jgi:3-hydroxyacyl-CoA dehydrogenase/enoyl-CoA hydratase/3-hydroxybutyryl-CoA epimerase
MSDDKYATLEIDDGIAYICVDVKDERVNTLSTPMTDRFETILTELKATDGLEGAVIYSGKEDNFIAGFDIKELKQFTRDQTGLRELVERGHRLMASFEEVGIPFVAAIHGSCLGGGLEVALACQGRVATDADSTKLGLPEVQLGVIPGAGGTQRLPRLVGLQTGMQMILQSKQHNARKAKKIGLVDEVVHPGIAKEVAADLARSLSNQPGKPSRRFKEFLEDPASEAMEFAARTPARKFIFDQAREMTRKNAGDNYPAPYKAIDAIETGYKDGFDAGIEAETDAFVELLEGDVAPNLINLFFMKQQVDKAKPYGDDVEPRDVDKIGVIGAGLMGAGIAQVAAYNGYEVRMKDVSDEGLGWGLNYAKDIFDKAVKYKKMTEPMADVAWGRLTGTLDYTGFKQAGVVIEAVFEDLDLKKNVFNDLLENAPEDQIFASNTSTIPISDIAEVTDRPELVCGMHFFSPVYKMPLLEIIRTEETSDETVATALKIGRDMGKTCIVVKDGPGFFTSRVIGAYINEAGWILQEGARIEDIDEPMKEWGFPVGPMKLVDEVGIDVGLKAAKTLQEAFEERWDAPTAIKAVAEDDRKGKKNGKGFYKYEDDESKGVDESVYDLLPGGRDRKDVDPEEVKQRCWLAMLNECAYCLQEGIAEEPRDIDIGVIFGLGFPPFRGGILRHADSIGLRKIVDQMNELADKYGERLKPADILVEKAEKNESFYG